MCVRAVHGYTSADYGRSFQVGSPLNIDELAIYVRVGVSLMTITRRRRDNDDYWRQAGERHRVVDVDSTCFRTCVHACFF
jgi:hypothetical protein